jgi:hypothetical protein
MFKQKKVKINSEDVTDPQLYNKIAKSMFDDNVSEEKMAEDIKMYATQEVSKK